jgi:type II secretory ATPase GspE/PulE/Tfp pilus assembly ATPase PilB-like protein
MLVNEVMVVDDAIRDAILGKASTAAIRVLALENGMMTMLDDGFAKAAAGKTTIEEVLRVVHE